MPDTLDQRLECSLRRCFLCAGLRPEDLAELLRAAITERHETGDILFRKGDVADRFFVVLEGHVVLYVGSEHDLGGIARIVGPGETFAEAAICGLGRHPVTAEVIGPARLVAIEGRPLCRLLEERFDLVLSMLGQLSMQMRTLVAQITALKMKTTAERLASHLLGLTDVRSGPARIRLPYGKRLLASELGMKPETLSRAFHRLQALGVRHHREADALVVDDVETLRAFAEGADPATAPRFEVAPRSARRHGTNDAGR